MCYPFLQAKHESDVKIEKPDEDKDCVVVSSTTIPFCEPTMGIPNMGASQISIFDGSSKITWMLRVFKLYSQPVPIR